MGKGNKERVLKIDKKLKDLFENFKDILPGKRSIQREIKSQLKGWY
ncbi:hypothetical protein [Marinitoga lauensis]|nr:hypothetical protein [Marinitoga lauensis]